jgi:hypothetical protein
MSRIKRNRTISETYTRVWENRSEEYKQKISNKKSMAIWNKKINKDKAIKNKEFLKRKLYKIVPRENNFCGVLRESD